MDSTLIDDGGTQDNIQREAAQGMYAEQVAEEIISTISKATSRCSDRDYLEVLDEVKTHIEMLIDAKEEEVK